MLSLIARTALAGVSALVIGAVVPAGASTGQFTSSAEPPHSLAPYDDGPADPPARTPCRAPRVARGKVTKLRKNARATCGQARDVAKGWAATDRSAREAVAGFNCRGSRAVSCKALGARGVARVKFRFTPPRYQSCRGVFRNPNGTFVLERIRVRNVSCRVARQLLRRNGLVRAGYSRKRIGAGPCKVRFRAARGKRVILYTDSSPCS